MSAPWTNKGRLEAVLAGRIPDAPPHWELVFQLGAEMMGVDFEALRASFTGTEEARKMFLLTKDIEIQHRLIDEYRRLAKAAMLRGGGP